MKKQLLAIAFLIIASTSFSQSWIQKLSFWDLSPYLHVDSLTGIKAIEIAADGDIFVIANYGMSNHQKLYKVAPSGAPIRWNALETGHGGLAGGYLTAVKATPDSGCIVAYNWWGQAQWWHTDGVIEKFSKDGVTEWSQPFYAVAWMKEAKDVSVIGNDYYAIVGDSVVKFDHSGNIVGVDTNLVFPFQQMPNSDLIVRSPSLGLARIDSSGTVIWSSSTFGNCGCPASYYYDYGGNTVSRIDLRDGSTVWSKSYPWAISGLDSTADGGFVASHGYAPVDISSGCACAGPGTIFRADVLGDTLWSRSYDFPHYGLPRIKVHPSGNLITGGGFVFCRWNFQSFPRDYSSFITSLDSAGHGLLETTSLTWPGDANDNQFVDFNDDALYVTIAWGSTGQPRDTIDQNIGNMGSASFVGMPGIHSDYATDWSNTFANGANYKHADFNGDGTIDVLDINPYVPISTYPFPINITNWRLVNPFSFSSINPDFNLVPEQDTVAPGELIKYFVTIGSTNVPADSLYGLLFSFSCNNNLLTDTPLVNYLSSAFGTPGIDLLGYDFVVQSTSEHQVLISRIDHNNVYQLHDTIAEITMTAKPTISSLQTLTMNVSNTNALTFYESPVQFNVLAEPVVIDPNHVVGIDDHSGGVVGVFPNPADNEFTMHNSQFMIGTASVSIFNLMGEKVKSVQLLESTQSISVADLPDGFYTGKISSEKISKNFSFIVKH